jgi:hypothetical protein
LFLCPVEQKRQYVDQAQAEKIIGKAARNRGATVPVRAYHCVHCDHWHLTSQTAAKWAERHHHHIVAAITMESDLWVTPKQVRRRFGPRPGSFRPHTNVERPESAVVGFRLHPNRGITVAVMVLPAATNAHRHHSAVVAHDLVLELLGTEGTFWWCTTPVMASSGLERLGFHTIGQWNAVISQ